MVYSHPWHRFVFLSLFVFWGECFLPPIGPGLPSICVDSRTPSLQILPPTPLSSVYGSGLSNSSVVVSDRFLTLPFLVQTDMHVVQGWFYTWWGAHFGVDYISGEVDSPGTWKTFDVIAAADGEACVNCVDGPGNKVWIKHTIGNQVYYTYYGHLATIAPGILASQGTSTVPVTRGQKIGTAGNSGAFYIHLHFGVYNAAWVPVDPYDLYTERSPYYPNLDYQRMGEGHLFLNDPPTDRSQPTMDRSITHRHALRRAK